MKSDRLRAMTGRAAALALAGLLAAGATGAAEAAKATDGKARPVDERGAMPADGRVSIENIAGSVKVVGWDKAEIAVTGTLGESVERLDFTAGERSRVEVVYKENHERAGEKIREMLGGDRHRKGESGGADLTVNVPRGCRLEVEVVAAGVDVSGLENEVEVTAVSGDVDVRGACRRLEVASVSGNVEVDGAGSETAVETVSGNLKVRCGDADLQVETVTGTAEVDCGSLRSLQAGTVNGSLVLSGRPAAGAAIDAESVNGSITLAVPADASATFEVSTFNGEIENAFGQQPEKADRYAPGLELQFTAGGGAADVKLNTLNGRIRILKK